MTVTELIKKLQKCSPDADVFISYGLKDLFDANVCSIIEDDFGVLIGEFPYKRNIHLSKFLLKKIFCDNPDLKEAAKLIVQAQNGSSAFIQRKMKLRYAHAGKLIDLLEMIGIVGEFDRKNTDRKSTRTVKIKTLEELEKHFKRMFVDKESL